MVQLSSLQARNRKYLSAPEKERTQPTYPYLSFETTVSSFPHPCTLFCFGGGGGGGGGGRIISAVRIPTLLHLVGLVLEPEQTLQCSNGSVPDI